MDDYDNSPGWEMQEDNLAERWYVEKVLTAEKTNGQNSKQQTTEEVKKDGTYCA